jgi:putative FmdB family regulatory protein
VPTYQYACTECGEPLEVVQSFTDDALTECPSCGGRLRKLYSGVGIVFKGSGFYRNDSRASSTSSEPAHNGSAAKSGKGSTGEGSSAASGGSGTKDSGSGSGGSSSSSSSDTSGSGAKKTTSKSGSGTSAA